MYGSWDIKHNRQNHFGPIFPLPPPNNPQNQNFEKIKKTPEDILQMYTINDSHMMYGSWDMERDIQNLLFCTIFCPFTPVKTWKIKILKKWKKNPGDVIILQMCTLNDSHMMYGYWDMEHDRQNFLLFWTIFSLLPP